MRRYRSLPAMVLVLGLAWGAVATAEEPVAPGSVPAGSSESAPPATPAPAPKPKLIDLNTASREKLMTLPGMSERLADRVIAGRPYKNRVELKSRNIVPTNVFNAIVERVVAKSPRLAPKPTPK